MTSSQSDLQSRIGGARRRGACALLLVGAAIGCTEGPEAPTVAPGAAGQGAPLVTEVPAPPAPQPPPTDIGTAVSTPDPCDAGFELRAHGQPVPGDETPFQVPGPADSLQCFIFRAPADAPVHALRFEPVVEHPEAVHHMVLGTIETPTERTFDGKAGPCRPGDDPANSATVFWLPGNGAIRMPADVGLRLPGGEDVYYALGVHYVAHESGIRDRSGFRVCATATPPEHEAALHWLGSEDTFIAAGSAHETGVDCHVQGDDPVHVVSILPHMHDYGRRIEVLRLDAGGGAETLIDAPFDRWNQRPYHGDWELQPGEGLRVRCHFENPTGFHIFPGPEAHNEMCFFFTVAYPAGRLTDPDSGALVDGCMEPFDWSRFE